MEMGSKDGIMKYYIQYTKDGTVHLDSFYSEKARDAFERDFLRENQLNSDSYVELLFQGEITFAEGFVFNEDKLEAQTDSQSEKSGDREIKVGDRVRVLEDEDCFLKAGEIGEVVKLSSIGVLIQSENPTHTHGRWGTLKSNVELV